MKQFVSGCILAALMFVGIMAIADAHKQQHRHKKRAKKKKQRGKYKNSRRQARRQGKRRQVRLRGQRRQSNQLYKETRSPRTTLLAVVSQFQQMVHHREISREKYHQYLMKLRQSQLQNLQFYSYVTLLMVENQRHLKKPETAANLLLELAARNGRAIPNPRFPRARKLPRPPFPTDPTRTRVPRFSKSPVQKLSPLVKPLMLYRKGFGRLAIEALKKIPGTKSVQLRDKISRVEKALERGIILYKSGKFRAAISIFQDLRALEPDPKNHFHKFSLRLEKLSRQQMPRKTAPVKKSPPVKKGLPAKK